MLHLNLAVFCKRIDLRLAQPDVCDLAHYLEILAIRQINMHEIECASHSNLFDDPQIECSNQEICSLLERQLPEALMQNSMSHDPCDPQDQ